MTDAAGGSLATGAEPALSRDDERALVRCAFSAGWHMASLYIAATIDTARCRGGATARWEDSPPADGAPSVLGGATVLGPLDRARMVARSVARALTALDQRLPGSPPPLQGANELLATPPVDVRSFCRALDSAHRTILIALTAAGAHLGDAYDLGRQLAYVTQAPETPQAFDDAFGPGLVATKNTLADLASLLPDHASRAVILSLRAWERWAADPQLDGEPIDWRRQCPAVRSTLRRQGILWAALLSGEKRGEDMLQTADYLSAATGLVGEGSRLGLRMLGRRPVLLAAAAIVTLLGVGVGLLVAHHGLPGQLTGAVLAAAGAVGLTGAGARARAAQVASGLQTRLWNAELDAAIAGAITIGPDGWGIAVDAGDVPAHGGAPRAGENVRTLVEFRAAVTRRAAKDLGRLVAPRADLFADGERPRDEVVARLLDGAATELAAEPTRLLAGRPGYLLAELDDGRYDVWRVQEGRVRVRRTFRDEAPARAFAGMAPTTDAEDAGSGPEGDDGHDAPLAVLA